MLTSSRRVKKGPGRRPQSAKRRWFMQLRERGWSVRAAAREVGISRTTGANWSRGYKTYRNGVLVGFVPPLERLAVRKISARFLSQDERIEVADLRNAGSGIRQIAKQLGRSPSTISRELRARHFVDQGRTVASVASPGTTPAGLMSGDLNSADGLSVGRAMQIAAQSGLLSSEASPNILTRPR